MDLDLSIAVAQIEAMLTGFVRMLPSIILGLIVLALFYFAAKGARTLVKRVAARQDRYRNIDLVLGRLAQWCIALLGLMIAVTIIFPTFSPGDLITILGIGGVAIGFAFKDIFQNFLAGILILLTEPFRVGDQIIVGEFEGNIEEIQTRATFIRTYDGRRVVIPNSDLFTDKVIVNTAFPNRRSEYDVGIGYGDDIATARSIMLEAVRDADGVLADPAPDVLVVALADSTVNLRVRWWSAPSRADVLEVQDRVLQSIRDRLTEQGVDMPFPTQVVLFHDQTEETDGDRGRQREGWPAAPDGSPAPRNVPGMIRQLAEGMGSGTG